MKCNFVNCGKVLEQGKIGAHKVFSTRTNRRGFNEYEGYRLFCLECSKILLEVEKKGKPVTTVVAYGKK